MGITFRSSGSFSNMERFLSRAAKMEADLRAILESAGRDGVTALSSATPADSGLASQSWGYKVFQNSRSIGVVWTNTDKENGFPVAIMLQYGYATGTGGYVQGRDYINPVIQPIMDRIANDIWKVVTSA